MDNLSNRELDVLRQFSNGYTVKQVAKNLFLSSETVRSHKKRIYAKLDINNGIQLGMWIGHNLVLSKLKSA